MSPMISKRFAIDCSPHNEIWQTAKSPPPPLSATMSSPDTPIIKRRPRSVPKHKTSDQAEKAMWRYMLGNSEEVHEFKGLEDMSSCDIEVALSVEEVSMHFEHSDEVTRSPALLVTPITPSLNPEALPYQPIQSYNRYMDPLLANDSNSADTHRGKSSTESASNFSMQVSQASTPGKVNDIFWRPDPRALNTKAHTWKSNNTKLAGEYMRLRKLVGFIAPEQFKNPAKPTNAPCQIVPTNYKEYLEHRREIAKIANEQVQKNIAWMKTQIEVRERQAKIQSVLGKDGRIYDTGLSPVLAQPTIWSAEYQNLHLPLANWPTQSELHVDGDSREQLQTRCGRYLPAPRFPISSHTSVHHQPFLQALPLDQTGPIYWFGPSPVVVAEENEKMDKDPNFEKKGSEYLGAELMDEIGRWSAPAKPNWVTI